MNNQISSFEYVSILISIILGLGITQILSSFSDLLYNHKKVIFYWPHSLWVVFVLFLHIQDWFITYQLKEKTIWHLSELTFMLLYPIMLFMAAKILLPTNDNEERFDMKKYYFSQFIVFFSIISISILLSISFNLFFLQKSIGQQSLLILFFIILISISLTKIVNEVVHRVLAFGLLITAILSVILEQDVWIIK